MKRRHFLLSGAAVATAACDKAQQRPRSDPNPVAMPLVDGDTILTVRGGDDGQSVITNPTIVVGGRAQQFIPGSAGEIRLVGLVGQVAAISAPGHIAPREVRIAPGQQDVGLWYLPPGIDVQYVRCLAYKDVVTEENHPLSRVVEGSVVYLSLDATLGVDAAVRTAFKSATEDASRMATPFGVSFAVTPEALPKDAIVFLATFEPENDALANARAGTYRNSTSGGWIIGGRIAFPKLEYARTSEVVAHELGHVLGLMHSRNQNDLMHGSAPGKRFTEQEILVAKQMAKRLAGNAFTDADPGTSSFVATQSLFGGRKEVLIIDK